MKEGVFCCRKREGSPLRREPRLIVGAPDDCGGSEQEQRRGVKVACRWFVGEDRTAFAQGSMNPFT